MTEAYIQSKIATKLRKNGWIVNTLPKPPGHPDITAFKDKNTTLFIEVKKPGKEPTALQELQMSKLRKMGFPVFVLDNHKDLKKILNSIGHELV